MNSRFARAPHKRYWSFFEVVHQFKRGCLLVLGSLLLFCAVIMLVGASMMWRATSEWPRVEGRMRKLDIRPSKSQAARVWMDLEYQYTVNGQPFTGDRLSPMNAGHEVTARYADRKRRAFPVGRSVDVIYDPGDPARSFLEIPSLFWDVLLHPISFGGLGAWMIYLFVQSRRRRVPGEVAAQGERRFADGQNWTTALQSVIDRDHVVLRGTAFHFGTGSLLTGWPRCHIALVASPNQFFIVPGPYTKRGLASALLTLALEVSLARIWLPAIHGILFLSELWRRRTNWRKLDQDRVDELCANEGVTPISIDEAVVYGFDPQTRRLWFRLPEKPADEFVQMKDGDTQRVAEFIGFVGLMQKA